MICTSGTRFRFGLPHPPSKIVKFSNTFGHVVIASKQSLSRKNLTTTTHKNPTQNYQKFKKINELRANALRL